VILFSLTALEWRWPRPFSSLKRWYAKPIRVTTIVTVVVLLIAIYFENSGHNLLQNSNVIGILGLIGIVGTIIGVVLTYEQLKLAEDRIEGYEKFYEVLHEILTDPKSQFFQFFGSTIIPGQVAFGDDRLIEQYKLDLYYIATHLKDRQKLTLILPSAEQYKEAYKPYVGKIYRKKRYDQQTIDVKIDEALQCQNTMRINAQLIELKKKEEIAIVDAFYFSNGRTAVYAVPLHYNIARIDKLEHRNLADQEPQGQPILVGFKTTNGHVVAAFQQHFEELTSELSRHA
jgi:hypothetical protein